ncbi:MAG: PAS domain S-box protein, partial [Pseudomonadota bacterium]
MTKRQLSAPAPVASAISQGFLWPVLLLILTLGAGIYSTWLITRTESARMREEILIQVRMLSKAINLEHLQKLTGSEADLSSPDYQRIKAQLILVRSSNPLCRFLYLMGRRQDGKLFFFADSELPDSKDYSFPGQIFEEASDADRLVFAAAKESVDGPTSDRWGTWISALVPVIEPQNKKITAVIGMDIDARNWNNKILIHALVPVVTTFLFAALLLFFILQVRTEGEKQRIAASKEALRQSEERFRTFLRIAPVGIFITDADGFTNYWNERLCEITGMSTSEGKGTGWANGLHPEDRERVFQEWYESSKARSQFRSEYRFVHRSGRITHTIGQAAPVKDASGRATEYVGTITDITELK